MNGYIFNIVVFKFDLISKNQIPISIFQKSFFNLLLLYFCGFKTFQIFSKCPIELLIKYNVYLTDRKNTPLINTHPQKYCLYCLNPYVFLPSLYLLKNVHRTSWNLIPKTNHLFFLSPFHFIPLTGIKKSKVTHDSF